MNASPSPCPDPCSPNGSPDRRERRRDAILNAARKLFIERGFEAISLAEIVRCSGGSLATLYELFENKHGLLASVVQREHMAEQASIRAILARQLNPAETLYALGAEILTQLTRPDTIGLIRVMMAESLRNPVFGKMLHNVVQKPFHDMLSALFQEWTNVGLARIPDPAIASGLFMGMLLHIPHNRAFTADQLPLSSIEQKAVICDAVRLFASGYGIALPQPECVTS